jgi:hypothetical protein
MVRMTKRMADITLDMFATTFADGLKNWSRLLNCCGEQRQGQHHPLGNSIICPPEDLCLPRCLLRITRSARVGEVIIVPFRIRNTGNTERRYKLGVRPFLDENGAEVGQATLDSIEATVPAGGAVRREMRIQVNRNYKAGEVYETDIVIRERSYNQNICFRLTVSSAGDVPEVTLYDERDLGLHFHRWYHHYYCARPALKDDVRFEVLENAEGPSEKKHTEDIT